MDFNKAIFYLFVLAALFIGAAYYVGSTGLLKTLFSGVNTLDQTVTGRNAQNQLASYPTGG